MNFTRAPGFRPAIDPFARIPEPFQRYFRDLYLRMNRDYPTSYNNPSYIEAFQRAKAASETLRAVGFIEAHQLFQRIQLSIWNAIAP